MFRRFMCAAAVTAPVCFRSAPLFRPAFADEAEAPAALKIHTEKIVIVDAGEDEDDAEWMIEKEKCSFCKSFLHSPCKIPFRHWMKCIDKSKELEVNMVDACADYSAALFGCTADNSDFFQSLIPADDDVDEEGEEGEGGHSGIDAEGATDAAHVADSKVESGDHSVITAAEAVEAAVVQHVSEKTVEATH